MSRSRAKAKGRRETGTFVALPHSVLDSPNWVRCGGNAMRLVVALARAFNGRNNGSLGAPLSVMRKHGFASSQTLARAIAEAEHYGLIVRTRQGGLNHCTLFALSWQAIDHGPHELTPTNVAPGNWSEERAPFKPTKKRQFQNGTRLVPKRN